MAIRQAVQISLPGLEELEAIVEKGIATFVEVAQAILQIRDRRLYHEQGHKTFEDYCRARWNWGRNYANKQIAAAEVVTNLGTVVPKPITERQARELARLTPEQQRAVAPRIDFSKATAKQIRDQVRELIPRDEAPKPDEARRAAIETGKPVLDSEGWYQPPVTVEHEEAIANLLDLFDLIVGFPDSELLKHSPPELLKQFAALRWPQKSKLRGASLDRFIAWLMEFENERKKRCE